VLNAVDGRHRRELQEEIHARRVNVAACQTAEAQWLSAWMHCVIQCLGTPKTPVSRVKHVWSHVRACSRSTDLVRSGKTINTSMLCVACTSAVPVFHTNDTCFYPYRQYQTTLED
jgi:hypothetical protein